ncbi:MlaD family protein [Gordonia sp. NPDC003376]
MSGFTSQDFLRGDGRGQLRTLALAGTIALAVIAIVVAIAVVVYPRATEPTGTAVHLVVPALGPGIKPGSKVLLHGAEIGEVTEVVAPTADAVEVDVVLDAAAASSLTDDLDLDFRPANYFGITAVNLVARQGGAPLRDGQTIERTSAPDFTMSTMLERGSIVVDGSLTKEMISSLDKVMRYANGLAPLIETGVIVTDKIARTQQNLPSTLLHRMNDVLDEFPAFNRQTMIGLYAITESPYNTLPDGSRGVDEAFHDLTDDSLTVASDDLFGKAGALLASHGTELTPLVTLIQYLMEPLPGALGGGATVVKTRQAIAGLQGAFTGTDRQKTLQLRVVLDSMPAFAGPLQKMGATTTGEGQR